MAKIKLKQVDGISRKKITDAYEAFMRHCKLKNLAPYSILYYEKNVTFFLNSMPNVIVTSHQAFLTEEALNNIAETTVGNILSYFENDGVRDNELCYRCGNIERCKKERKEKCF